MLFWPLVLVNGLVFVTAAAALALSPTTTSTPVTAVAPTYRQQAHRFATAYPQTVRRHRLLVQSCKGTLTNIGTARHDRLRPFCLSVGAYTAHDDRKAGHPAHCSAIRTALSRPG